MYVRTHVCTYVHMYVHNVHNVFMYKRMYVCCLAVNATYCLVVVSMAVSHTKYNYIRTYVHVPIGMYRYN